MIAPRWLAPLRRVRALYVGLVLVGIAVIAAVVGVVLIVTAINQVPDKLDARPKVAVPGTATLRLTQGERGIWLETRAPSRPDPRNVGVTVTPAAGGEPLPVLFPRTVDNYDLEGRRGALIGTVVVPTTGDYVVVVDGRGGSNVSIGATTSADDLVDVSGPAIAFSIAAGAGFLGIITLLVAFIRHIRRQSPPRDGTESAS